MRLRGGARRPGSHARGDHVQEGGGGQGREAAAAAEARRVVVVFFIEKIYSGRDTSFNMSFTKYPLCSRKNVRSTPYDSNS